VTKVSVPGDRAIIHDACIIINLFATGHARQILASLKSRHFICTAVQKESLYLRAADPTHPLEPVALDALISAGQIEIVTIASELEEQLYVDCASRLDDGEAMSMALAHARHLTLATDDRKCRRIFAETVGDPSRLLSTAGIVREWADQDRVPIAHLRAALRAVAARARFIPAAADPDYGWWTRHAGL
jgi:predicted nucleic acid-binding protein